MDERPGSVPLAELVAALSLATDLATGQPLEHALATCRLAMAVADRLGLGSLARSEVFHVALLRFLGCTADAAATSRIAGGDNLALLAAMAPAFMGTRLEAGARLIRSIDRDGAPLRRARRMASAARDPAAGTEGLVAHCEVGARLAERLGLPAGVVHALAHAYERWDGHGLPDRLVGEAVPIAVRVAVVARDAVLWQRVAGDAAARDVLLRRRGHAYAPAVVDAVLAVGMPGPGEGDAWQEVLSLEPRPVRIAGDGGVDSALAAMGDFADLRSPWTRGRSARLGAVARAAGVAAGLGVDDAIRLGRAGLVADVGAVGVPVAAWDAPGATDGSGSEQVRLHPYLSERVLGRCSGLHGVALLAGAHHERLDGTGYHRGCTAAQLDRPARIVAAAEAWVALTEDRPGRRALPAARAADALRTEVAGGRLDRAAVDAVVAAEGGPRRSAGHPGLSEREVEVLGLVARGLTNRQIATRLFLSPKTVGHHVGHVYAKTGVRTRAGAALFAMEHGLLAERE